MSEADPAPTPLGSWFGPIPAWRFALLAAIGVAAYVGLAQVVDGFEVGVWPALGALVGGMLLGVPMGRQDARGTMQPRRGASGRLVWPGMAAFGIFCAVFVATVALVESAILYSPLFLAALGTAGVTGGWSRDRALAAGSRSS